MAVGHPIWAVRGFVGSHGHGMEGHPAGFMEVFYWEILETTEVSIGKSSVSGCFNGKNPAKNHSYEWENSV